MTVSTLAQLPLFGAPEAVPPPPFEQALVLFSEFPYKRPPYSARNWGHALHSLCSYASKLKPALAASLVRLFTQPGDIVLDPFCGVGTVPFEAGMAGRHGVALDLSPFAYCVAAGKVRPPQPQQVAEYIAQLACYLDSDAVPDPATGEQEIVEFFHEETWREVLLARQFFIERESTGEPHPAHWFIKACAAHILHGNRPYALSRRSHGIIPIPPKGPTIYKSLMRSLDEKAARMDLGRLPDSFMPGEAHLGSAFALPLAESSVDAIITSPPFLGTTEFLRQNRLRLWFCGMDYASQRAAKIGTNFIENHKTLVVYGELLREFRRVVRPGGLLIFHLGVVKQADMARGISPFASQSGFEEVAVVYEDTTSLESHGRTDRGATHQHQFLFLRAC